MELQQFNARMPQSWGRTPLGEWRERLHSVCGRFHPHTLSKGDLVTGGVSVDNAAGMEIVQVATDVDYVRRSHDDVRLDRCEHMFLLLQLEGNCGVEQDGSLNAIRPGDCILVDSAMPATFHFKGEFSNHLSIHLPRQTVLADAGRQIEVARRLEAEDPMSVMLLALTAKLLRTPAADPRAPQLRQLLIQATRQAFASDPSAAAPLASDRAANRLELAQMLIDRNLSEERLSPQWLARKLGVSLRTLQDDFSALGATATSYIRDRRLKLAREMLSERRTGARAATIAEVAYAAGFNDISYFNRSFKKAFSCQPRDVCRA
jgi:AraC-like DNA-binding protein